MRSYATVALHVAITRTSSALPPPPVPPVWGCAALVGSWTTGVAQAFTHKPENTSQYTLAAEMEGYFLPSATRSCLYTHSHGAVHGNK